MRKLGVLVLIAVVAAMALPAGAAELFSGKDTTRNPSIYYRGETIHYVITLQNQHPSETIVIESVVDTFPDGAVLNLDNLANAAWPAWPFNLAPGQIQTYEFDYVVPNDAEGTIVNSFRVVGYQISTVNDPIDDTKFKGSLIRVPCVSVDKSVDPETSKAGDEVEYTIRVCNCGTPAIDPVSVIDSILGDLSASYTQTLAAGECEEHDFPYEIQPGDPDPLVNVVEVVYVDTPPATTPPMTPLTVSDDDDASVDLVHPDFTVTKSCMETGPVEPNTSVIFRIVVTNTGDVALDFWDATMELAPFSLDPGGVFQEDVARLAGEDDVFNQVILTATLPVELGLDNVIGPKEANDVCPVGVGGATRTLGFWKTHCIYAEHVFEEHCGGQFDLGWIQITSIEDLTGVFYANVAKNSDGSKRDDLCKARINPSWQAIAALLNNCLHNGAPLPVSPAEIAAILGGTDKVAIKQLGDMLDDYNNSGDDVAIVDLDGFIWGNATPKACKAEANIAAADCLPVAPTSTGTPRARGR